MDSVTDYYGKTYPVTWKPISSEAYWDALEALPPAIMNSVGFLLGEAWTSCTCTVSGRPNANAYRAYAEIGDKHYQCNAPLTVAEFKTWTRDRVLAALAEDVAA